jgi:hypothetical protein
MIPLFVFDWRAKEEEDDFVKLSQVGKKERKKD